MVDHVNKTAHVEKGGSTGTRALPGIGSDGGKNDGAELVTGRGLLELLNPHLGRSQLTLTLLCEPTSGLVLRQQIFQGQFTRFHRFNNGFEFLQSNLEWRLL